MTRDPPGRPPPHIPHFVGYHVTDLAPAAEVCDSLEARALNNLGQIVGVMLVGGRRHAFAWSSQIGLKQLANHGADVGATCLNDGGTIAGWIRPAAVSRRRACLWRNNAIVDLGAPANSDSVASDINSHDVVVGVLDGHACCSKLGQLVDLGTLGAWAINDDGQLLASNATPTHYLLTPIVVVH